MSNVVEELTKVLALGGLSMRFTHTIGLSGIYTTGYRETIRDGVFDVPAEQVGTAFWVLANDGTAAAMRALIVTANPPKSVIGQLQRLAQFCWEQSQELGPDLTAIKLEYRKVGSLVEADIVSFTHNWWNYVDAAGRKVQALFCNEFHEGPDIRTIVARFIYDPQSNTLMAR